MKTIVSNRVEYRARIQFWIIFAMLHNVYALTPMEFRDNRSRRINEQGLTMVDWEGKIANPIAWVTLVPPSDATYPAQLYLSMANARQYFTMPLATDGALASSTTSASGPRRNATLTSGTPWTFGVGLFPDDDGTNESRNLTVRFVSGNAMEVTQTLRVNVM